MTTVINTPSNNPEIVDNSSGWFVAVTILLAIIAVGSYYWINRETPTTTSTAPEGKTNVTVVVPAIPEKTTVSP